MKKMWICVIVVGVVSVSVYGQSRATLGRSDPARAMQAEVAKLHKDITALRQTIGQLQKKLADITKERDVLLELCKKHGITPSGDKYPHGLQALKDALQKLAARGQLGVPEIALDKLSVGKVGRFEYPSYVVIRSGTSRYAFQVQQIIDNDQMLVKIFGKIVWVRGIPTNGIVDDQYIELDHIFYIAETKTYETAMGGTKTVFVAELVDIDIVALIEKQKKDNPATMDELRRKRLQELRAAKEAKIKERREKARSRPPLR